MVFPKFVSLYHCFFKFVKNEKCSHNKIHASVFLLNIKSRKYSDKIHNGQITYSTVISVLSPPSVINLLFSKAEKIGPPSPFSTPQLEDQLSYIILDEGDDILDVLEYRTLRTVLLR